MRSTLRRTRRARTDRPQPEADGGEAVALGADDGPAGDAVCSAWVAEQPQRQRCPPPTQACFDSGASMPKSRPCWPATVRESASMTVARKLRVDGGRESNALTGSATATWERIRTARARTAATTRGARRRGVHHRSREGPDTKWRKFREDLPGEHQYAVILSVFKYALILSIWDNFSAFTHLVRRVKLT